MIRRLLGLVVIAVLLAVATSCIPGGSSPGEPPLVGPWDKDEGDDRGSCRMGSESLPVPLMLCCLMGIATSPHRRDEEWA